MALGFISYINSGKTYGFIDSPELHDDHIFFHSTNCHKSYSYIYKGDKVEFDLVENEKNENEAKNISFIQNASLDGLRKDFNNKSILKGFLKKIGDRYYVKDKDTYIYIPLTIAKYETQIDGVYEKNLNTLIDYKITTLTENNKIRAIHINRIFLPECSFLVEGNTTEALVFDVVKGGYQIKMYENIMGFLPNSFVLKSGRILGIGDLIQVTCVQSDEHLARVVFDLTENIEKEINLLKEKESFFSLLAVGNKYRGKIKSVQGFGIFVSIGFTEGLLHVSRILGEKLIISKSSKKEFLRILKLTFIKDNEIDVFIDAINEYGISLSWDISLESNKELFKSIYTAYTTLKTPQ